MNTKTEKCIFAKIDELQKGLSRMDHHIASHSHSRIEDYNTSMISRLQANLNMYIRKCDDLRLQHMQEIEDKNGTINWQATEIDKLRKQTEQNINQIKQLQKENLRLLTQQHLEEDCCNMVVSRTHFNELKKISVKYYSLLNAIEKSKED